jgi:DNA replication protein DnaC
MARPGEQAPGPRSPRGQAELSHACIEAIDYPARRELDKAVIRQLATYRWVEEHHGVLISGMTGTGKRFLACALAHQACRKGYRVLYRRASPSSTS